MTKYSNYIGLGAAIILIVASFMPWAYYPDLHKDFSGFFSENNVYGKPGKVLIFLALIIVVLILIPRVWAKRANQFLGVLTLAYAFKSYIVFTSCYRGICPEKKIGLWLVMISTVVLLLATIFPNIKLKENVKM